MLEDTAKTFAPIASGKGIELACDIRPEVPSGVRGDPSRLRQVINNLLGNALKFTDNGEVVLRVQAEGCTDEIIHLHFSVSDTGIGIPTAKQSSIFEAFSQADSSITRKYGGTGLGLTISARLVRLMGGQIWVESDQGKGTVFHFTTISPVASNLKATETLQRIGSLPLMGMSALIADDSLTSRRILADHLTGWGMRQTLATSWQQALSIVDRALSTGERFDVVLLDVQMPGIDARILSERLKQQTAPGGALILLTSPRPGAGSAQLGHNSSAVTLTKPVKRSELFAALMHALTVNGKSDPSLSPGDPTRQRVTQAARHFHVLLAEDNFINQKLAETLLQKRGHSVAVVGSGREALDRLSREAFDLVLMDVQMPEMDGIEATAAIRQNEDRNGGHIPIVAMTACGMKGDAERCLAAGMDAYVAKPINPEALFEAVESAWAVSREKMTGNIAVGLATNI
jgi:CheY-like chemotaxis protein